MGLNLFMDLDIDVDLDLELSSDFKQSLKESHNKK